MRTLSITLIILFCVAHTLVAQKNNNLKNMNARDFEKAWEEVGEYDGKGLPESALKVVQDIARAAKAQHDAPQQIKAVIYQLKLVDAKQENAFVKNLQWLKTEAEQADFPVQPVLYSLLAEHYWQYYESNRYRFYDRSTTVAVADDDIETWNLDKIIAETFHYYKLSLADAAKSKQLSIATLEPVLQKASTLGRQYRPTLYDFLAHRALAFFQSSEPDITQPAETFEINDDAYFAPAARFVTLPLASPDTLSTKLQALRILQDLLTFHLRDEAVAPRVMVDLQRLSFAREHYGDVQGDTLYIAALQQLEQTLGSDPLVGQVAAARARMLQQRARQYDPLQGDTHKWAMKEALQLCERVMKQFPKTDGAILCEALQYEIMAKSLKATVEENNIPGQPFRSLVTYCNITDLYYRMVKVTRAEVLALRKRLEDEDHNTRQQKFLQAFINKTPVKTGHYALPDDGDYQAHKLEIKLDAVPEGEYILLYSHQPDFAVTENALAYAFTVVTNISYVHRSMPLGTVDVYTLDRDTGAPLAGVEARVFTREYNRKAGKYDRKEQGRYTSDKQGYFQIPYKSSEPAYRNFSIDFYKNKDFFSTDPLDNGGHGYFHGPVSASIRQAAETHTQTFFFLDRAIYRPGQTIYFKGLVVDTDGKHPQVKKAYTTKVALYDVNGQQQGTLTVTTNAYGSFQGLFTAPAGGLTGNMQIRCDGGNGSVSFSVEEYKRPKFEAGFDPITTAFQLNDTIAVAGYARAYSGANIDGASVAYRVDRTVNFPLWCGYRWPFRPAAKKIITQGHTVTDAAGKFIVDFTAQPDLSADRNNDPTFTYHIQADITDLNGETHSTSTYVTVGYRSLQVYVPMADINQSQTPLKNTFDIQTQNLAGVFQPTHGNITIWLLKAPDHAFRKRLWEQPDRHLYTREEYYKLFPHDLYADEDNFKTWEKSREVLTLAYNTGESKTFTIQDLAKWTTGDYLLEIKATDKNGQPVREIAYFKVFNPTDKHVATPAVISYQPIQMKTEPGETASFSLGTSMGRVQVLYEIEKDGTLLASRWLTLKDEQKILEIPIEESYRGNIFVHYMIVKNNRLYAQQAYVEVPYTNKVLDISFATFRDKLQPGLEEQWQLTLKGSKAEAVAAEMVATMYDASLDQFRSHSWSVNLYPFSYPQFMWQSMRGFDKENLAIYQPGWNQYFDRVLPSVTYDAINWFGYNMRYPGNRPHAIRGRMAGMVMKSNAAPVASMAVQEEPVINEDKEMSLADGIEQAQNTSVGYPEPPAEPDLASVKTRTNFNETAFFFPQLKTNDAGEIILNFTMPEALTRWKMMGFAHAQDLKTGMVTKELVTQKELMVVPNQPRFFREGDAMMFQVKVSSLVDRALAGQAKLEFFDALTMKPVSESMKLNHPTQSFTVDANQSTVLAWSINIPEGLQAITYRVVAQAGNFSDGEEMTLPVVTNRMLVTESMPLAVRGNETKTFTFKKLKENHSATLRHQRYTLEFTPNPAWYAVQALPYLMEYPYDCTEQTFSRYYANSLAAHMANSTPRIKQIFEAWKNLQPTALLSNLEKNEALKTALLEETPWVLQAQDETARKHRLGVLFDLNRMANEQARALHKIIEAQGGDGGFSWFPGLPTNPFITQHIIAGMGQLDKLGVADVRNDAQTWEMITAALAYLDQNLKSTYDQLLRQEKAGTIKLADQHISQLQYHYLYTRSFFKDVAVAKAAQPAFDYYKGQAQHYWTKTNLYTQGLACLALHRWDDAKTPADMIRSFNERALHSEEMGMYWKYDAGYYWYQAPIETQALMVSVYDEVAHDTKSVDDLKAWLLKQKQTQDWKTTKATVEACYALLQRGTNLLTGNDNVEITVGGKKVDATQDADAPVEAGTGYFKTSWAGSEIKPAMANVTVTKKDAGLAWGAVYWQYTEQLDKITPAATPLRLKKQLFLQKQTDRGPVITPVNEKTALHVGDLVTVRIELRVDRTMEYIHLKDMRAAAFEPVETLSTHKYQDGLYYYQSPRDLATNFFIGYLPKGTYVFEYNLRVSQQGNFSNGVTTIQCMYAPEFSSHSEGVRVTVE